MTKSFQLKTLSNLFGRAERIRAKQSGKKLLRSWHSMLGSALVGGALLAGAAQVPLLAQTSVAYQWKNVQMLGGGLVSGVIYSPTTKDLAYARTDVGGAYRLDAATKSWIPITDHLSRDESNFTGVLSVAIDPSNANRVYLATGLYSQSWAGTGAILASTDKGANWTRYNLSIKLGGNEDGRTTGERLQVDPNLGSTLYLGSTTDGLWKSTNSGASWTKVTSFPVSTTPVASGGLSFVLFDKKSSAVGTATKTIYVGVLQKGTTNLYKSVDAGVSWQAVAGQATTYMPHQAALAADGTLYVTYADGPGPNGITAGDVRKLAGGVWTSIKPDNGQGGYGGISLDPQKPGTLVVSTIDRWWPKDEIFRSTDGGTTWKGLLANATWDHSLAPYAASSTPHWTADVDIDPFNSNNAWFITGYGVYGTSNLLNADNNTAVKWSFLNKGIEETVPLGLISPPSGAPLLSALGDIDGFKHDNVDVSPTAGRLSPQFGTNPSIDFAEKAPATMARTHNASASKFGAYSTNGGTNWTAFPTAPTGVTGGGNIAVSADGTRFVWSPAGAGMHYSTNKGTNWTASTGIATGLKPVADRVNSSKFYAYNGLTGQFMGSTNGGASFSVKKSGLPILPDYQLWAVAVRTVYGVEGDIWLSLPDGLYHSTDSGVNFTKLANVQESLRVGFGKAATGKTYPSMYMVGTINGTKGFFRSDDAGANWVRINDSKRQFGGINDIIGDPRTYGRVYVATGGRGIVYGSPAAARWSSEASLDLPNGSVSVYPNPSAGAFTIQTEGRFSYVIYNQVGQVLESGNGQDAQVVGSSLNAGLYLIRIQSGSESSVIKVIKY